MRRGAWRLAALVALMLFLFFGDAPERLRFWNAFFDAGHTVLFGVVALIIDGWLRDAGFRPRGAPRTLTAFGLAVGLGAATELLQTLQARGDPSVVDLLRDTAGAGAFLLLAMAARAAARRPRARAGRAIAVLAALALLLAAGWTLIVISAAYVARDRAFPTLFALDGSWWEAHFIDVQNNRLTPRARTVDGGEQPLARLDLEPGPYSGIAFDEPYPDWRGRRLLRLTIVSDLQAPLPMAIRIHDSAHDQRYADRFNRRLTVAPGTNDFVIPIADILNAPDRRLMDLRRIRGVILFAYRLQAPVHVFLGPLRLE